MPKDNILDIVQTEKEESLWVASFMGQENIVAEAETEDKAVSRLLGMHLYAQMMGRQEDDKRIRS